MADIGRTFGALLVGGITAAVFSGIVTAQAFSYFNNYPKDATEVKLLALYGSSISAIQFLYRYHFGTI